MDKSEVGRVFSSLSLVSALSPFLARPLYSLVYNATLDTFPGAFLVFTGAIILAAMAIMSLVKRMISDDLTGMNYEQVGQDKET